MLLGLWWWDINLCIVWVIFPGINAIVDSWIARTSGKFEKSYVLSRVFVIKGEK